MKITHTILNKLFYCCLSDKNVVENMQYCTVMRFYLRVCIIISDGGGCPCLLYRKPIVHLTIACTGILTKTFLTGYFYTIYLIAFYKWRLKGFVKSLFIRIHTVTSNILESNSTII